MTLFEITGQLRDLWEMLEAGEMDEETLIDTMEAVEGDFEAKAEGYAKIIKQMEADADNMEAMADEFLGKMNVLRNGADRLKNRLLYMMDAANIPEVKGKIFKIKPVNNGGVKPLVLLESMAPEEFPEAFQQVEIKVNKKAIREALDQGEQLSFAHYGERGRHLTIK